jgi:uncharacterized Zn finger protein (UPF0148 family)
MMCTECGKPAVTKDGRSLCLKCLRQWVNQQTPMVGCYKGMFRTSEHKQARSSESPGCENAVRAMEDRPND